MLDILQFAMVSHLRISSSSSSNNRGITINKHSSHNKLSSSYNNIKEVQIMINTIRRQFRMLGNDGTECLRTFWWQQRRQLFSRYIYMVYFNLNVTYIHIEHNVPMYSHLHIKTIAYLVNVARYEREVV